MATFRLDFDQPLNFSVQVGDEVFKSTTTIPGTGSADILKNFPIIRIGVAIEVGSNHILIDEDVNFDHMTWTTWDVDHIMFAKNKNANTSGLLGYYIDAQFINNSLEKAELFAVGSDVTINS